MRQATTCRSVIVLFAAIAAGCTTFDYENYGACEPDLYFGTQPGFHVLSEHFAMEVTAKRAKVYHLDKVTGGKVHIGTMSIYWFDRSNYGPRETYYAISADGRRLIFFDEPGVSEDKPVDWTIRPSLYVIDESDGQRRLLFADVHRHATSCVVLPRNYVRFSKSNTDYVAYSTDGDEVSLEARRKHLHEAGRSAEICGPLR